MLNEWNISVCLNLSFVENFFELLVCRATNITAIIVSNEYNFVWSALFVINDILLSLLILFTVYVNTLNHL